MIHWVPVATVAIYIVALFSVTWWARHFAARGPAGMVGYLLAGRQLPPVIGACLLAGLAVGGASTIGVAERAYTVGISAGWYNAAWAAGAWVLGLGAAKRYRRLEVSTLPELFERHYTVGARLFGVGGQLLIQIVITSLQYMAGGAILSALMPELVSYSLGMAITAAVFVGITLMGGFWATGLTNVINVAVIYAGILLGATLTVGRLGGVSAFMARLPADHPGLDLGAVGPGLMAAWFLVMITQAHSTQAVIQIGFAARNASNAARTYLIGGFLILPIGFIAAILGTAAAVLYPGILPAEALPRVVLDLPPLAAGVILAGLWAADVSTASALLMGSATLVCTDVIRRFYGSRLNAARERFVCRLTIAGLSVVTYLLAVTVSGILKVLLIGLSLSPAYALIVLMTLYRPGWCRRSSATWTLGLTMAALVGWLLVPPNWHCFPHPIYFTWLVSGAAFLGVAIVDKRPMVSGPLEKG